MMKPFRFLSALLLLAVAIACSDDEGGARLTLSTPEIVLRGDAGSAATVTVTAEEPWTLTVAGSGFEATPEKGGAGETLVTLTALDENPDDDRRTLGNVTFLTSSGGKQTATVVQSARLAPQTLVMYLPWAGNLYEFFLKNIKDAKAAVADGHMGDSRMLVFLQTNPTEGTLRELYHDNGTCEEKLLRTYEDIDVTQAETIAGILRFAAESAPARKYAMTIGSHGMAWIPAPGTTLQALAAEGAPQKYHWEYVSEDGMFTRWFGDGGAKSTNVTTLAEAIRQAEMHLEYILFDDCFMSSIEVAYDLKDVTHYLIASPCEIMNNGFPYDKALPYMFTDGGRSYDLEGICRSFYDYYEHYQAPRYNCGTIAVTVCSEVEALAGVMRQINAACPPYAGSQDALQRFDYIYTPTCFFDFGDYVHKLCPDLTLTEMFDAQMARTVPLNCRFHTEYFYSNGRRPIKAYSGISTSEPSLNSQSAVHYKTTAWYKATHGGL